MPTLDDVYHEVSGRLAAFHSAPGLRSQIHPPFASILHAWLSRNLDRLKVVAAFDALRDAGLTEPQALAEADPAEILESLKAAGVRLAPRALAPLKRLAKWASKRGEEALADAPTASIRDELVAINGIGPGTADAILLEGLDRPVYPLDRPSFRIFARHGWIDATAEYDEARDVFDRLEPENPEGLRQLSHALEQVAAQYCKTTRAKCERCPLKPFLPEAGPILGHD